MNCLKYTWMLCEQSVSLCEQENERGFMRSSNHRILALSSYLHLTRELYIGLVCVINVLYIHTCMLCMLRIAMQVIELKSWALDAKFGMRVTQLNFTYSNILLCSNRKWDKCRFFSLIRPDSRVCCKHTQTDIQTNRTEENILYATQERKLEQWTQFYV